MAVTKKRSKVAASTAVAVPVPVCQWTKNQHALIWRLIDEVEKDENRKVLVWDAKGMNTSRGDKIAAYRRIAEGILPDRCKTDMTVAANRIKSKWESLRRTYLVKVQFITSIVSKSPKNSNTVSEAVGDVGGGDDESIAEEEAEDEEEEDEEVQYNVPLTGPDETTTAEARNTWDRITQEFRFFPRLHLLLASDPNLVSSEVQTSILPALGKDLAPQAEALPGPSSRRCEVNEPHLGPSTHNEVTVTEPHISPSPCVGVNELRARPLLEQVAGVNRQSNQPQPAMLDNPRDVFVSGHSQLTNFRDQLTFNPTLNLNIPPGSASPLGAQNLIPSTSTLLPDPEHCPLSVQPPSSTQSSRSAQSPHSAQSSHSSQIPPPPPSPYRYSLTPEHDSETYARLLLPRKLGWPLWLPRPIPSLPPAYRREGVSIGDVGIITANGEWDYLWNIRWEADDERNRDRVPMGFRPVERVDISVDENAWKMGSRIINGSIRESGAQFAPPTLSISFTCTPSEGAVTVLPLGGSRCVLLSKADFEDYAGVNAESWYKHVNTPHRLGGLGRGTPNGSLYLVTEVDKTKSWGIGSFTDVSGDGSFRMNFCNAKPLPAEGEREIQEQSDGGESKCTYEWTEFGLASANHGPVLSESDIFSADDPPLENQCIFLRGFRVAIAESIWDQLFQPTEVRSILDLPPGSLLARNSYIPFSNSSNSSAGAGGLASYFGFSRNTPSRRSRAAGEAGAIVMPDFPMSSQGSHPSDSINAYLLKQNPSARVALTHDNTWISVVEDGATKLPNPKEMIESLEKRYEKVTVAGVVSFQVVSHPRQGQDIFNILTSQSTLTIADQELMTFHPSFVAMPDLVTNTPRREEEPMIISSDTELFEDIPAYQDGRLVDQDSEWQWQESTGFPPEFDKKVDMRRVDLAAIRPWIIKRLVELVGFEAETVTEHIIGLLEDKSQPTPDPKRMQLGLERWLANATPFFMRTLWKYLLEVQSEATGVPCGLTKDKKEEVHCDTGWEGHEEFRGRGMGRDRDRGRSYNNDRGNRHQPSFRVWRDLRRGGPSCTRDSRSPPSQAATGRRSPYVPTGRGNSSSPPPIRRRRARTPVCERDPYFGPEFLWGPPTSPWSTSRQCPSPRVPHRRSHSPDSPAPRDLQQHRKRRQRARNHSRVSYGTPSPAHSRASSGEW